MYDLSKILNPFFEFIAPSYCEVCQSKTYSTDPSIYLCNKCYYNLPLAPTSSKIKNQMMDVFPIDQIYIDNIYCLISSKDTSIETQNGIDIDYFRLIYALKYEERQSIGFYLGQLLAKLLDKENSINYDLIMPLPLHSVKKRERGFNQSELISNGIANKINLKIDKEIAYRKVYTNSQTQFDIEGRIKNTEDIFNISTQKIDNVNGKSILIVDDVFTTGSTSNSLAKCLKQAGASKVDSVCVIKA